MDKNTKNSRVDIAAWTAIIIGILLGFLLKRVKFGIIIGLVLGVVIVFLLRKRFRNR